MKNIPKILIALSFLAMGALSAAAQGRNMEEVRETLRFIRLAETKKRLSFDEDKLIKLNEILDAFEEGRFALKERERRLRWRAGKQDYSEAEAEELLEAFVQLKRDVLEGDIALWNQIRELLTAKESVEFFAFYEKFQQEIQRRIRMLQQERRGQKPMRKRRP